MEEPEKHVNEIKASVELGVREAKLKSHQNVNSNMNVYCYGPPIKNLNDWSQALRFLVRTLKQVNESLEELESDGSESFFVVIWLSIHIHHDEWSHHSLKWVSTHWSGTSDVLALEGKGVTSHTEGAHKIHMPRT